MIWMVKFLSVLLQMKNHKWGFFNISKVSELWMSNLWAWNVPLGHDRWNVEWINGFELLGLLAISFCNVSPLECQLCLKLCSDLPRIQKPGYLNMNLIWIFLNSSKFKWTELWTKTWKQNSNIFHQTIHIHLTTLISYWMPKMCWRWKKNTWMKVILQWQLHYFSHEGGTNCSTHCSSRHLGNSQITALISIAPPKPNWDQVSYASNLSPEKKTQVLSNVTRVSEISTMSQTVLYCVKISEVWFDWMNLTIFHHILSKPNYLN